MRRFDWSEKACGTADLMDNLAHRKKQTFPPLLGDWFKGASSPWLKELLQKLLQKSELLALAHIATGIDLMLELRRS